MSSPESYLDQALSPYIAILRDKAPDIEEVLIIGTPNKPETIGTETVPNFSGVIQETIKRARVESGGATRFAADLENLGFTGEQGQAYSQSAVSNWVKGRTIPPADVFLGTLHLLGHTLDPERPTSIIEENLGSVHRELAEMRGEIDHIYAYLNLSPPPID